MQEGEEKEQGQQAQNEDDEDVICSNQLLAAIRARIAAEKRRDKQGEDPGTNDNG